MRIKGERQFQELPNTSKSVIKTFKYFCDYLFWRNVIFKEERGEPGIKADIGTDTHLIFAEFWGKEGLNFDYIFTLEINPMLELDSNPVTHYFYGVCVELTPIYDREVLVLQRIFWRFACLHSARFLYYYKLFNGNKMKIWKYFAPMEQEQFYTYQKYGLYGTIDVAFLDINEELQESIYIPDYKTGNVPSSVLEGPKNMNDQTSVTLPTKFMFEIHFYGMLWLFNRGWYFDDERVDRFVLNDEYLENGEWKTFGLGLDKEEQFLIDKRKKKYITKMKPVLVRFNYKLQIWQKIGYGDITLGIIFLSGDPKIENPVVVKKKFGSSLKNVLHRINEIKVIWRNRNFDKFYLIKKMKTRPEYNKYKCINCSRNQKCLEEIEQDFKRGL